MTAATGGAAPSPTARDPIAIVPPLDQWDLHVEAILSTALERWRDNRDPGTLLELLGPVIAAVGRRGAL